MSAGLVIALTIALIALSAFFVAVEFALIAAKRHRLEDAALSSRSARAALRSSTELSVLLAGSQLGITACTLALGAITKPAVHHGITPLAQALGLPLVVADVIGFVLALVVVTFLHLVVGEMAPKSWAVAHPERSAILLALPMRAFMVVTRPVLRVLNAAANACLRMLGVEPVDQVEAGHTAADLRALLAHSVRAGTLDAAESAALTRALDLSRLQVQDLVGEHGAPVSVGPLADAGAVRAAARTSRHLRILVRSREDPAAAPDHVVHVRDTMGLEDAAPIRDLLRPVLVIEGTTPLGAAFTAMRENAAQLALVRRSGGGMGVVTVSDVLEHLLPSAEAQPVGP
ncbi:hemolysin family protein [Brachybacterium hainanense]|uniref:Hemolysin family protein n=1 Tax=Brachybacterium hainanense TaxID=1541174 RepID=A0ABV6RGF7_9MICO